MGSRHWFLRIFIREEPRVLRAGWRFLIFIALFLITVPVMRWFRYILTGRASLDLTATAVSEPYFLLQRFTGILGLAIATLVLLRWVDKKPFSAIGTHLSVESLKELGKGALLGVLTMSAGFLVLLASGAARIESFHLDRATAWAGLIHYVPMTLLVGMYEEVMFRGYMFQVLCEGIRPVIATILLSIVFGGLHYLNPGATAAGAVATGVWSLLLSVILLRTRSLWVCIGLHFTANLTQGFFLGSRVSAQQYVHHLVDAVYSGPEWLSGGSMGIEAALPTMIMIALCFPWILKGAWWRPASGSRLLWQE
jgi:membrane protease YdiL (CAAX protease family)